ncbi:hypothetical protein [Ruegeria arenilitoris]|uniref:hypothetical protein n=1 Tax=Ruegeria arenilitoris TaxID=1173585 RepID=UPI0014805DC1|nr:hypothetical protein [Ruegeria arenilitoris]
MEWWAKNAKSIEALAAVVTVFIAISALIGAKVQLDRHDQIQREQSARDAYRAHLALATAQPQYARPLDACSLVQSAEGGAYVAFVDHLLYSAEQMLAVEEGWSTTFSERLSYHSDYLCSEFAPHIPVGEVGRLVQRFGIDRCPADLSC